MEAQFDHGFLHVGLEQASVVDLCGIVHSHVPHGNLHVSVHTRQGPLAGAVYLQCVRCDWAESPVNAPRCHGEVEQEHKPVHGDQH